MRRFLLLSVLLLLLGACTEKPRKESQKTARAPDPQRGKSIYLNTCAACHNIDPAKDGPIGPSIKGSSQGLLEARILRASYPPGYKPKRSTAVMPAQPYLEPVIPDLAAFLR